MKKNGKGILTPSEVRRRLPGILKEMQRSGRPQVIAMNGHKDQKPIYFTLSPVVQGLQQANDAQREEITTQVNEHVIHHY